MSGMHIEVDDELVEPIIKAEIQAAIVRQLQSDQNLIPKLVEAALVDKVDESGKKNKNYSSSNKYLFIDILCKNAIQDASNAAMKEYIEENQDRLKREIKKQLKAQDSEIARLFIEQLIGGVQAKWSFNVTIPMPGSD
jgi:hypothetical protein